MEALLSCALKGPTAAGKTRIPVVCLTVQNLQPNENVNEDKSESLVYVF